jgi:hypothetical protein
MIAQLLFAVLSIGTLGLAASQFLRVYRNIQLGKAQKLSGDSAQRWKNVLLIALGQQKMFARPISAIMHLFVYLAFLITQIELIEIFIDGFTGNHRFFFHHGNDFVKGFYNFMIGFGGYFCVFVAPQFAASASFPQSRDERLADNGCQ